MSWVSSAQVCSFSDKISALRKDRDLPKGSSLRVLHPFLDAAGILRVGGRVGNAKFDYSQRHPIILHSQHPLTRLIIWAEHIRLLHAGATLTSSSLSRTFHIIGQRKSVRDITRSCIVCRKCTARPRMQVMGQLPLERVTPGMVFQKVGVDYAGPLYLKLGRVRKPTIVKSSL